MDISYICIGDELLDGRVRDRHTPRLGAMLERAGHRLVAARTVPDRSRAIRRALDAGTDESKLVVVSGGLGPTADDATRRTAADWAGRDLEFREDLCDRLRRHFEDRGYAFTENNERQCYVPEGARVLPSEVGTASAFVVEEDETECWFLPGVPREFQWYLEERLADRLEELGGPGPRVRSLTFLGIGESTLETRISEAEAVADARDVSVGFRADAPVVEILVRGGSEADVDAVCSAILDEVGNWKVSSGGVSLAERAGALLESEGAAVATAESCTAGWISKSITDVPGSSSWFEYGFATYADRAKIDLLGVDPDTLETRGAVSSETVREMARGARERTGAEFSVAVSGIAGPTGGTEQKPVGTVQFGLGTPEGTYTHRLEFPPKSRRSVRRNSVQTALGLLIWRLDGLLERHSIDGPVGE